MTHKLKMSNTRFRAIMIPLLCLLVVATMVANSLANTWRATLDVYLGKGDAHVVNVTDTSNLDLDYYDVRYTSDAESLAASIQGALQVAEEGQVLMKNNGTLPLSAGGVKITPFGYRYVEPIYGGTGSGNVDVSKDYVYTPEKALNEIFGAGNINSTVVDLMKSSNVSKISETGITVDDPNAESGMGGFGNPNKYFIMEYDPAIYDTDAVRASCAGTVGLVFIGRFGGESDDLRAYEYADGTPHQLALSTYEKEMLSFAKANCDQVVVIINSSNQMELGCIEADDGVDAILWVGGPGGLGFKAMAEILAGQVNPSGRTVDTYYANFFFDPAVQNWGQYQYANSDEVTITGQRGGGAPGGGAPGGGGAPAGGPGPQQTSSGYNPNYLEYEEGIYMGYRFYETAWYMLEQAQAGAGDSWYNNWRTAKDNRGTGVVYPFGYGLSYTTFTQEIAGVTEDDGEISVKVKVTNTGSVAGKDTAQIYVTAPYTDYDRENGIEKAYVTLAGFAKTGMLEPGASETVTVTIQRDDLASYSYKHENADGTKGCYILEAGDYILSCRNGAHTLYGETGCEYTYTVKSTVFFEGDELRSSDLEAQSVMNEDGTVTAVAARSQYDETAGYKVVNNKFENMNEYMSDPAVTNLTRANWGSSVGEGSFPTKPNVTGTIGVDEGPVSGITVRTTDRIMSDAVIAEGSVSTGGGNYDYANDPELGNVEGSKVYAATEPTQGADNGLKAIDLRGVDYYSPMWDDLLDQIDYTADYEQIKAMLFNHSYGTSALDSTGFPQAKSIDGPVGLTMTMGAGSTASGAGACAWPSEVVVAATYNTELVELQGTMIGEEAFQMSTGEGVYVNGWYAPGIDMHRSPFNGRNFEYYSEDPTLSGKMAAAVITGAANKGLVTYMKHFVLNDQELMQKCTYTWCNEQTFREIYLRPYEIAIKEATMTLNYVEDGQNASKTTRATMGIMTSHNHVGATWAGSHYNLLTEVVRGEWGFLGCIVTDNATGYATSFDRMVRSGNDMWMGANMGNAGAYDTESATSKTAMRNAIHNILYTYINSNLMNNMAPGSTVYYDMSPWEVALRAATIAIGVLVAAGILWIVLRTLAAKKNPALYIGTKEGNAILAGDPEAQKRQKTQLIVILVIAAIIIAAIAFGCFTAWNWYEGLMRG